MYIWHILKVVIYVIFCFSKNAHSDPPDQKEYEDSPTVSFTSVHLDLNDTKDSSTHYCHTDHGKSIFQPKNGYGFSSVVIGKSSNDPVTIWKSNNDSIFSNKVVFIKYNSEESEVIIYLSDGSVKNFVSFSDGNWTDINLSELTTVGISIESMDESFAYTNNLCEQFRIFTIKDGFIFNGLYELQGCSSSKYLTVWESRNNSEYANKIIVDGGKLMDKPKNATIFLTNGTIKHYSKMGSVWVERSLCIEIDVNFKKSTFDYVYVNDGVKHIYEPRYDFKISKIKFGTSYLRCKSHFVFWEAKDKSEYAKKVECISVTIDDPTYVVILIYMLNGNITKLVDGGKGWFPLDLKKVVAVQLALGCVCDSFAYRVYENGTFRLFEPKEGYLFYSLIKQSEHSHSTEVVWETKNLNELAHKVIITDIKVSVFTRNIIIYHISGKFTHLQLVDKYWIVIEPSMILDINDKENNMGCEYFKDNGEIEYFIPMGGLLFKEVVETEGLISKTVVNIWKAKNKYEYAYKAVLIKLERNSKYLVLLLVNKNILLFHMLDKGKPWVQRSVDDLTLHELKMMAVDLSDPRVLNEQIRQRITRNTVEIVPSEPSVVSEPQPVVPVSKPIPVMNPDKLVDLDITKVYGIRGYDIFYRDNRLIFEARENYFFKSVTKNDQILWKPKNITDLPNRVLYKRVNNNDKIKVYFPDKIKEEPSKPKPKLSIDPSTILVDASKCRKPGSEFIKATVVEVSGTPANSNPEVPEDLYVAPKEPRKKQWVVDDD